MERTRAQWEKLLASVGPEIERFWTGSGEMESIIEGVAAAVRTDD